jgi:predicted SnoaL-like aldol condensation-catalyzing enzyme
MRFVKRLVWILALAAAPVLAQGYLSPLEVNKKVVFDFYRLVFEPRNTDLAEQFVAEDFIEHNPRFQSGRANLVKMLKSLPPAPESDVGPELQDPPALIIAEGDLVTYIFKKVVADPQDKSKSYERFSFDTFRVKDKKIVEHWDGATK